MATKKPSYKSAMEIWAEAQKELKEAGDIYGRIYEIRQGNFRRTGFLSGIQTPATEAQKMKIANLNRERNRHMRRYKALSAKIRWDSGQGVYVMR